MLGKLISVYKIWQEYLKLFPKNTRHSLGIKIDILFTEVIESITTAAFLQSKDKIPWVRRSATKLDTLKVFLQVAWEVQSLDIKKYIHISELLLEIGRNLGGWHNQLEKQNSFKLPKNR